MIEARVIEDIAVFRIEGDFTRLTCTPPTLQDLVKAQLAEGKRKVVFNFEKAGFVDSFGVGEIFSTYLSTQNLGGRLALAALSPKLFLTLSIIKVVPGLIPAYPNEESAVASFAAASGPKGV